VVLAETKDHLNWDLIGQVAKKATGEDGKALKEAHDVVEPEEDEHLYHTTGWTRELWIDSLGIPAVLPPPEEERTLKRLSEPPERSRIEGACFRPRCDPVPAQKVRGSPL